MKSTIKTNQPKRAWPTSAAPLLAILQEQAAHFSELADWSDELYTTQVAGYGWTVAEHLEHLTIATRSAVFLIDQAAATPAPQVEQTPNDNFRLLLSLGHFPRGQTESPDFARPRGVPVKKIRANLKRMVKQINNLAEHVSTADTCAGRSEHPELGFLTLVEWWQFLAIHQNHHLEILSELKQRLQS